MITDYGKEIIAKYLAGQVGSPFEYLALGAGPQPETPAAESGYESKVSLDLESIRVPITQTSVVEESGSTYLVLSGTVPSDQRYEFSEIGVYPGESDTGIASLTDKTLFTFSRGEGWVFVDSLGAEEEITYTTDLDDGTGNIKDYTDPANSHLKAAMFTNAANILFTNALRPYGTTRVLSDALMLRCETSLITGDPGGFDIDPSSEFIRTPTSFDFSTARPDDELVLGLALISGETGYAPDFLKVVVEFKNELGSDEYARFEIRLADTGGDLDASYGDDGEVYDFINRCYYTVSAPIGKSNVTGSPSDMTVYKTAGFDWGNVNFVSIYADVEVNAGTGGVDADNFYLVLDALRFVSKNTVNPNYGLVAYSIVQNATESTIKKESGRPSKFDYRIKLDVA